MKILKYEDCQSLFVKTEDLLKKSYEIDLGTKKTIRSQSIKDFSNLSLFEILTLQILLRHDKPIIRHALYQEVNQYLQFEDIMKKESKDDLEKNISTSSFYNNLKNLERAGLLSYIEDNKGKTTLVKQNKHTHVALDVIEQHFLQESMDIDYDSLFEGAMKIIEKMGKKKFGNILLIWPYEFCDSKIFTWLETFTKSVFIICKKDIYKNQIKKEFNDFIFSQVKNKLVREPDNFFEATILVYKDNIQSYIGLDRCELLKESVRITEKGGNIIIFNFNEIHHTENSTINKLIDKFSKANRDQISSASEIKEAIANTGLEKYEVFDYKELIFGLIWVD